MGGLSRTATDLHNNDDDLPPPYSENPPVNPFYNEHTYDMSGAGSPASSSFGHHRGGRHSLDHRRSDASLVGDAAAATTTRSSLGSGGGFVVCSPQGVGGGVLPGPVHPFTHSPLYPVRPDLPIFGQVTDYSLYLGRCID